MKKSKILSSLSLLLLSACTIDREVNIYQPFTIEKQKICIVENKDIRYPKFKDILFEEVEKHGFLPKFVENDKGCPLTLMYTAEWGWDMAYYLTDVNLEIYKREKLVADSKYHVTGGSGNMLIWYKYRKSITIINEMLDELKRKLIQTERRI